MNALIDLRTKKDVELYEAIQNLYEEPLNVIRLGEQPITACIGCWNCWLKTPGRCVMKDQTSELYRDYVNSHTVILLMDTAQGFINHQTKAFLDRTIPHYHPYIEMVDGECHHAARYERYPDMVFYYDAKELTKNEEQIIEDYLYRTAYHFKSNAYRILKDGSLQLRLLESRKAKNQTAPFGSTEPIEKLVIYNGSPRRSGSNSVLILAKVAEALGDRVEIRDLKERDRWDEWAESFKTRKMFFSSCLYMYMQCLPTSWGLLKNFNPPKGA